MTLEEFKNIAPKLHELQELKSGFSTPKDYFGTVEDDVCLILAEYKLDKKTPFKTPENYFSTIEDRVFNTIKSKETESTYTIPKDYFNTVEDNVFEKLHAETKVISLKSRFIKTFLPIAAAASLVLFFTLQLLNNSNDSTDLLVNLEISEIESWIDNGDLELDSYEIAAIYENVDFDELEINQQYNYEYLIEYLEDIDIESLYLNN
jgi:hypothetical protein